MILEAKELKKKYPNGVEALKGVSFSVDRGKTLGVLGESGCGKSTLAKIVAGLLAPDSGEVHFRKGRPSLGIVFQEPFASLDPRMTIASSLGEPFFIQKTEKRRVPEKTKKLLSLVELPQGHLRKYPRELSGGECQRVVIARALAMDPELLICDEPVSSLDAIVRAQILNLLLKIQADRQISMLFISHDLRVVRHMSDTVLVMKDGLVCETGPRDTVFKSPQHPYTRQLFESACKEIPTDL